MTDVYFDDDDPDDDPDPAVDDQSMDVLMLYAESREIGGASVASDSVTVTVHNVLPTIILDVLPTSADEGDFITITGTISDPSMSDTFDVKVRIDFNYDGDFDDAGESFDVTLTDRSFTFDFMIYDDGPSPGNDTSTDTLHIVVEVKDDDMNPADAPVSQSASILINNVAPELVVTDVFVSYNSEDLPAAVTITGEITDPGFYDSHDVTITWGDGYTQSFTDVDHIFSVERVLPSGSTLTLSDLFPTVVIVQDDDTGEDSFNIELAPITCGVSTPSVAPEGEDAPLATDTIWFEFNAFIPGHLGQPFTSLEPGIGQLPGTWGLQPGQFPLGIGAHDNEYWHFGTNNRGFGGGTSKVYAKGTIDTKKIGCVSDGGVSVVFDASGSERTRDLKLLSGNWQNQQETGSSLVTSNSSVTDQRSVGVLHYPYGRDGGVAKLLWEDVRISKVKVTAAAGYPFASFAPNIDFDVTFRFEVTSPGHVEVSLVGTGTHDKFPYYEALVGRPPLAPTADPVLPATESLYSFTSPDNGPGLINLNTTITINGANPVTLEVDTE